MSKDKGKQIVEEEEDEEEEAEEEEEEAEDWCFVCKDGGNLLLCDHKGCIKAYHPSCIGKKNKVLKSEGSWICHRHSCAECGGPPQFYCLACPDSVCRLCVGAYEFVRLKLDKGLCKTCFELALLAEKNAEIDSEGEKLDFQDPTTDEFLFKEYLLIIMEQEELTFDDLHHAYSKRENYNSGSDYDKNKDKDDVISISDADNCSDYASDDSFDKIKRSRKREPKNKLCDLLKSHFANTLEPSILDGKRNGGESRSVNEDEQIISECKRPRTLTPYKVPIKVEYAVRKSCYASVVVENIKLVYLRRSLVEELLMHPDTFEEKVVGSFVRVKRKPGNCLGMTSFQLLLVTGVKKTSNAESNKGILLEVSCMPVDIPIDMLNDDDISEEECIDLQQRIKDGIIKRPTVVELEQKAKSLHEDITKHWIQRELVQLQGKIDFAHEKGRKYMLERFLYEREMLQKPSEQQRLLQKLPRVIAEEVEVKRTADRNYSGNNCPTGL
ncbi:zinc finger CCCH domain-containing protein 19 isoform X2 [Gossypium hirsutum]|uniref:Zinc finger CCCH domain-containing protein 19 isoform X2 n=1 Tax=Gossypium hirsutum TaxID=3635 RepID=A0ABM2YKQ8_GOSHI|nr:zinc finger CCCH domain-containing protein 19-like isoform X2 [Gossypium hirsutum]